MHRYNTHTIALGIAGITAAAVFSVWLMFHTFSYDPRGSLRIASKAWSDFGAHIPLVRSFSRGDNLTRLLAAQSVESPLFPGEPIRYHYGFYAMAGILEKLGVRIDYAVNIPSAAGFTLLLVSLYWISLRLFHNHAVSVLSVLFFLCNGSLSFFEFFREHPLSSHILTDIITNSRFPSFGPWDGGPVTAFWNLNIYTNQRHLALSYGLALTALIILLTPRPRAINTAAALPVVMGLLMFINFAVFASAVMLIGWMCLMLPGIRRPVLIAAGILCLPLLLLTRTAHIGSVIRFDPWYLTPEPHTVYSVLWFWISNVGIHAALIPAGMLLAPRLPRRLFAVPLLILFVAPNLFRFSTDMINNHKFFNFAMIIGVLFSAYAVVSLWTSSRGHGAATTALLRFASVCTVFMCTLSGLIDLFPVINDHKGSIPDFAAERIIRYIARTTAPGDIVANSTWFYHPASLAGRSVLSGYTYFTWSYGYDQSERESIQKSLYAAADRRTLCSLLSDENIVLTELSDRPEEFLTVNTELWSGFKPDFRDDSIGRSLYRTTTICGGNTL